MTICNNVVGLVWHGICHVMISWVVFRQSDIRNSCNKITDAGVSELAKQFGPKAATLQQLNLNFY